MASGGGEARAGVALTHLDQPLLDGSAVTKRDLVDYLDAVSEVMLAELAGRPLSVIRVRPGQPPFMQKNTPRYAPDWLRTATMWAESSRREISYPVASDRRSLLWLANQRAVEFHPALFRVPGGQYGDRQPGRGEAAGDPAQQAGQRGLSAWAADPDYLVLDLDPPSGADFGRAVAAAMLVREALHAAGLAGGVKTSGAKGVHVFVPVTGADTEQAAAATRAIAARAERLDPVLATTAFIREDRGGKVFLDSTRAGGATVAAAYSPRIRPGLPVSFPVRWADLEQVRPADFTIATAPGLVPARRWHGELPDPQRLPAALVEEGRQIPVARVAAMHEGKRRARARRATGS